MPKHYIQICSFLSSRETIFTIDSNGLSAYDFNKRKELALITFDQIISINYQFNNPKEVLFIWHYQQKKDQFKQVFQYFNHNYFQVSWRLFTHDRDTFLTDYYISLDIWKTRNQRVSEVKKFTSLIYDQFNVELELKQSCINIQSKSIINLEDDLVKERYIQIEDNYQEYTYLFIHKLQLYHSILKYRFDYSLLKWNRILIKKLTQKIFLLLCLIIRIRVYRDKFIAKQLIDNFIFIDDISELILKTLKKMTNQYLGFVNSVSEEHKNEKYKPFKVYEIKNREPQNVNLKSNIFEQFNNLDWGHINFSYQQIGFKVMENAKFIKRVMVAFDQSVLYELEEDLKYKCINAIIVRENETILIYRNGYLVKNIQYLVRPQLGQENVVKLIFKDEGVVQYYFEPLQRDIFISSLLNIKNIGLYCVQPALNKRISGFLNENVNCERYLLQLMCSSKDSQQFYENLRYLSVNLSLNDYSDNSTAPVECLSIAAEQVFNEYLNGKYGKQSKVLRILTVMKSEKYNKIVESIKNLKNKFKSKFTKDKLIQIRENEEKWIEELNEIWVKSNLNNNPIKKAMKISLVCSFQSQDSIQYGDQYEQYKRKCQELVELAENTSDESLNSEEINLIWYQIDEILNVYIHLVNSKTFYQELTGKGLKAQYYEKIINQIIRIAIDGSNQVISYKASNLISKIILNFDKARNKYWKQNLLLNDNYPIMSFIIHALSSFTLLRESDQYNLPQSYQERLSLTINANLNQQLYHYKLNYPSSFMREELYTFNICGLLTIIESLVINNQGLTKSYIKLFLQYLQTPYFIAIIIKLIHYKSLLINQKATRILMQLLALLKQDMFDLEVIKESKKPNPCAALLIYTRNYELIQTLLLKNSSIILQQIIIVLQANQDIDKTISIQLLSHIFYNNKVTSQFIYKIFPKGLFVQSSQNFKKDQYVIHTDYSDEQAINIIKQWNTVHWQEFFNQIQQNYDHPRLVWNQCQRECLIEKLSILDFNFTYSHQVFLTQQQVDYILASDQPQNYMNTVEKELFSNQLNLQSFFIEHTSLNDLWYVSNYYLRKLQTDHEAIKHFPTDIQKFVQGLIYEYINPKNDENIKQEYYILLTCCSLYQFHSPLSIDIPLQFINLLISNGLNLFTKYLKSQNQQLVDNLELHVRTLNLMASVYERFIQSKPNPDDIKLVWNIYLNQSTTLVNGKILDLLASCFSIQYWVRDHINPEQWISILRSLLDILRLLLIAFPASQNLYPYPLTKQLLLERVRINPLLNQLCSEESEEQINQLILKIIKQQLNDEQSQLGLIKEPLFLKGMIIQLKNKQQQQLVLEILIDIFNTIKLSTPPKIYQKIENYIVNCMFIRQEPFEEERNIIQIIPFFREIPYQLARIIFLQQDTKMVKDILNRDNYQNYDLVWSQQESKKLILNIQKKLQLYRNDLYEFTVNETYLGLNSLPIYQLKEQDLKQFNFLQNYLQCGHIYLKYWTNQKNKNRKSQLDASIVQYFIQGIQKLITQFFDKTNQKFDLQNEKQLEDLTTLLLSNYYCVKLYQTMDNSIILKLIDFLSKNYQNILNNQNQKSQNNNALMSCNIITTKYLLITIDSLKQQISLEQLLLIFLKYLPIYKNYNRNQALCPREIQLLQSILKLITKSLKMNMKFSNDCISNILNHALQIFQTYCDLFLYETRLTLTLSQFISSDREEDLTKLLKLTQTLPQLIKLITFQQNIQQIEQLIVKGVLWRIIYLITFIDFERNQQQEIKQMIIKLTHALRNILILQQQSQIIQEFQVSLSFILSNDFLTILSEENKDGPSEAISEIDQLVIGRFLVRISSNIEDDNLIWNNEKRTALKKMLNLQIYQNQYEDGNWNNILHNFKTQEDESQLLDLHADQVSKTKLDEYYLPNGFLIKILNCIEKYIEEKQFKNAMEGWKSAKTLILSNNLGILFEEQYYINVITSFFQNLWELIKKEESSNKNDQYFEGVEQIYELINLITEVNQKAIDHFRINESLLRTIIVQARLANYSKIYLAKDFLGFLNKWYDLSNFDEATFLIEQGIIGILFEMVLKFIDLDQTTRLEAFCILRSLIQVEWTLNQNENDQIQNQENLESYKILKIMPQPIFDLLTSDQEEEIILENFYKEWRTPSLIWTDSMLNETLLDVIIYNTQFLLAQQSKEQKIPINTPVYVEITNNCYISNIMLYEYNLQPEWPLSIPLNQFLSEIGFKLDELIRNNQFEEDSNNSLSRILTYLSSFLLCLEQLCYNENHPEFRSLIQNEEELSNEQIKQELQQQRDGIPEQIILMIDKWIEILFNEAINNEIKSYIMQIVYLITESEVGMVILQQTDFINNLFMFLDTMFSPKYDRYYQNDEVLFLFIIYKSSSYSFIRSSLKLEQIDGILNTISHIKSRNYQNDQVLRDILYSIIYNLINDNVKMKDTIDCINKHKKLQNKDELLELKGQESRLLKSIWRTEFEFSGQKLPDFSSFSQKIYTQTIVYPVVSIQAYEPIQQLCEPLQVHFNEFKQLMEEYRNGLNNYDFDFMNVRYENRYKEKEQKNKVVVEQVQEMEQKQENEEEDNEEIFC